MGWSTWESFGKTFTEQDILDNAQIARMSGLHDLGFRLLQIDDGWFSFDPKSGWVERENSPLPPSQSTTKMYGKYTVYPRANNPGCMVPDRNKFPRGMEHFIARVKAMNFSVGLYASSNSFACPKRLNLPIHYMSDDVNFQTDVRCFNKLNIDLLKIDNCSPSAGAFESARIIRKWRNNLNPNIVLYNSRFDCMANVACGKIYECPLEVVTNRNNRVPGWCTESCDMARVSVDMKPNWLAFIQGALAMVGRSKLKRPGFTDPDYLVPNERFVGVEHIRAQFSLWCVTSAPLIISADLTKMSNAALNVFQNAHAIRVDQTFVGDTGDMFLRRGGLLGFRKYLGEGEWAVVVVNVGPKVWKNSKYQESWDVGDLIEFSTTSKPMTYCSFANVWEGSGSSSLGRLTKSPLIRNHSFTIAAETGIFIIISNCVEEA